MFFLTYSKMGPNILFISMLLSSQDKSNFTPLTTWKFDERLYVSLLRC